MRVQVVGIAWYKREEYEQIRQVMQDGASLPKDFDAWLQKALQLKEKLKGQGVVAVEAYIDPSEFVAWCRGRGLHVDSSARSEYANVVAAESHRHGTA
jgi:hypothetical protein